MALNEDVRRTFQDDGFIMLKDAVPADALGPVRERVFAAMDRARLDHATAPSGELGRRIKQIRRSVRNLLDAMYTTDVCGAAGELLGSGERERHRPILLLTPPRQTLTGQPVAEWDVPRHMWHTDSPRVPVGGVPGVIALALLDDLKPGGGGTLVIAGSHRLVNKPGRHLRSRDFKQALKGEAFFDTLFRDRSDARLGTLASGDCVHGVNVRLAEVTGHAGDVALVDARVLHAPAPNGRITPRLMARGFFAGAPLLAHYRERYPGWNKPELRAQVTEVDPASEPLAKRTSAAG